MALSTDIRKHVVGRKIKKILLNPHWDSYGDKHYAPEIELDNGVWILFMATETQDAGDDYGVCPILVKAKDGKE